MSVFARDFDDEANGNIEYSLRNVEENDEKIVLQLKNQLNLLSINSKSGVIQTAAELDRENTSLIRLKVVAQDHGTPPLTSTALFELNVLDANDNAPKFVQFNDTYGTEMNECKTSIPENITVPAQILYLKAIDLDAGTNGKFF